MGRDGLLGAFEELVLLAVAHEGGDAYGMTVRREIERRGGRSVTIGAVYATLDRLTGKGYVGDSPVETGPARRGRARRYFRLTPVGARVLLQTRQLHDQMWEGIDVGALTTESEVGG